MPGSTRESPSSTLRSLQPTRSMRSRTRCCLERVLRTQSSGSGLGADSSGRLLEYIAVEDEPDGWLIFHCMRATNKVLNEIGSGR